MTELGGYVKQRGYEIFGDGASHTARMTRSGDMQVNTIHALYDSWLRAGKVFQGGFGTFAGLATVEINAAIDLTEPFIHLTVPVSKVIVPIQVQITYDTAPAALDAMLVGWAEGNTNTAGGAAGLVKPLMGLAADAPVSSACTLLDGDSVLTEDTLVNPRLLSQKMITAAGSDVNVLEYNVLKGDPWTYIQGVASFLVWVKAAGAEEVYYHLTWAELDRGEIVNA